MQAIATDVIVLAAALGLLWSFAPSSWRRLITHRRETPSYDKALQADELAGQEQPTDDWRD